MRPRVSMPIVSGVMLLAFGCGLGEGGLAQMMPSTGTSQDGGTDPMPDGSVADDGRSSVDSSIGDDAGFEGDTSSPNDSGAPDDVDTPLDAPVTIPTGPCLSDANACIIVPTGWTLVAFDPAQSTPCPAGFANGSMDFVDGPGVGASKCSCGACTVTSPPTCDSGEIPVHYDETIGVGTGTCDLVAMPGTGPLINNPPGSCGTDLYQGSYSGFDISYMSPPAAGGACTAPGAPSGAATSAGVDRACVADTAQAANCNGNACSPSVAAPFKPCILAAGAIACPAGALSVRHEVGSAASVTCPGCGCSVAAECSGTVTVYTDTRCTMGPYKVPADGTCNPIHLQHASYDSYIYSGGAPTDVSCTASDPGAPSAGFVNPTTICCAP